MSQSIKHILVIRLSAIGDVAMTVPVLKAFSLQYPEVKITVLTRAFFKPFFRDMDTITIHIADVKEKHKGIIGLYKLSKELKKLDIDAVADLHNVLRSKILKLFLLGKPFAQIDKGRKEKKALISGENVTQLKTTHQRYADVFQKLGFKFSIENSQFTKAKVLNSKLKKLIEIDNKKLIGIAPFAAFKSKAYPIEQMNEVIAILSKKHKILLFGGGKKEEEILNKIASKHNNVINLAGKLFLDEELDVISNLSLMISMDSGNAHIAAMLGKEVLTLWGVTHPFAGFYPFNQNPENKLLADRIQHPKIPTSIYGNKFPDGYENAIASISVQSIIDKTEEILNRYN